MTKTLMRLANLSWDEVHALIRSGIETVVLPTGSIEQHGYHLPLGTDAIAAEAVAERVAVRVGAILAPLLPYGNSANHMNFSGTVSLEHNTLRLVIGDICSSLARHGFKKIAIINGHGNNDPALFAAAREVKSQTGAIVTVSSYYHSLAADYKELVGREMSFREFWAHGGVMESAIVISAVPDAVHLSKASVGTSRRVELLEDRSVIYPSDAEELSPTGSYGDPRPATPEMGQRTIERVADLLSTRLQLIWRELEKSSKARPKRPDTKRISS